MERLQDIDRNRQTCLHGTSVPPQALQSPMYQRHLLESGRKPLSSLAKDMLARYVLAVEKLHILSAKSATNKKYMVLL